MTEKNRIVYETLMKVKNFTKGVSKVQAGFKKLSNLASAFATGFMGSQLLTMFQDWAKEAGKVETVNRSFSRSFGVMASETEASLIKMSTILKRNTSEMKKGAVSFQAFFTGLGFASKASSQMSVDLQKMSVDLASFFGIADANAQKRFLAALAGSPEVLDQFGINLKQAALQVELYNMGIKTTVQNTSETVKTTARLAIIMRSMSSAGILGDAFRSMDTYAGKVKALDSQFLEFQQNMGNVVIPVLIKGMETLSGLFTIIDNILKLRDLSDFLAGNAINAAEIRKYREELEKIKETQTILNFLAENNTRFRNADKVLNDEEYALFVSLVTKEKELKKLLEEGNLERTDEVELKKEHLYYSNEIQKFQVRINEQIKEQVKQQEELNRLKQIEADGFTSEIEAIKEKFDTQKRHQKLFEKDSSELETQKQLQQELLVIYGKQLKAGILTTKEYKKQTDELLAINTALMTVNTIEFNSIERERRRKATKDFDFVGAGDKIGSLNQRNLDLLGTSVISDQSAAMADALLDKDKFINRIKNTLSNIKIELVDVLKGSFQEDMRMMQISLEQIAMPFINASMQLFDQMLTPPDATLSKEEQKEKTKEAFAGIIVGLGQAMMAIGQGMILTAIGLQTLIKKPIVGAAIGAAMIGTGAILVKHGKGKLQNIKNAQHARNGGGTANAGGGVGGFGDFMNAIQGEQVFRLAGNDLVTAINRTNRFQGTIGG